MYVCQECKSTEFEKIDGFLYCLVCQVQQKDYIEFAADDDVDAKVWTVESTTAALKKRKLCERKMFIDNWTAWDAYNHILLGFINELTDTGLAPNNLKSTVLSLWIYYVEKTELSNKFKKQYFKRQHTKKTSSQKTSLEEDLELLHIGKRRKIDEENCDDNDKKGCHNVTMSQSSFHSVKVLERRLIKRHYQDFLLSEESKVKDVFEHDTIETIGRHLEDDEVTRISSYPSTSNVQDIKPPREKGQVRKLIPMCKGRALAMMYIGLLMCRSDVQLSDLLRFIREAHIAYAKITHFLPPEIKLTKENYTYLETVREKSMPTHIQLRKLGADVAKILGIKEFPFPNFSTLIKRYVTELRLPAQVASYAVLLSKIADVKNLCSFKRAKRIPNYEAMAAACVIVALKCLFGLDDRTEFLLSDVAEKANKLLKEKTKSDSVKLFRFQEWKKLIELRKTILSVVHYPTQEKLRRHTSSTGFLDMLLKESKDPYREKRFETYNQYHINPELLNVCKEVLETLIEPKQEYTMEFPPTLKPQTEYLKEILRDYNERRKKNVAASSSGCIQFSEIADSAMTLLVKRYKKRQVFFMHNPTKYMELLRKNGYIIRTLSKRDQIKLMADVKDSRKKSEDEQEERDDVDSGAEIGRGDASPDTENMSDNNDTKTEDETDNTDTEVGDKRSDSYTEDSEKISTSIKDDKMDAHEEESKNRSGNQVEREKPQELDRHPEDEDTKTEGEVRRIKWKKIEVQKGEFTFYVRKPEDSSYTKIERMPKNKHKGSAWSDICYKKLKSSKKVYFVKDMAVMWKLDSPWLPDNCNRVFKLEVFRKTPHNFRWIVCQFSSMLEMKVRDVYLECYKLEIALEKAKKMSLRKLRARLK